MPHPQDKSPISVKELPNPDLNPLLNPTLGRNLGRWAEVYFTSPPEKREEAVEELLRELQGAPSNAAGSDEPTAEVESVPQPAIEPRPFLQTCGKCGQSYAIPQRFCGMCGTALLAAEQSREHDETRHTGKNAETLPLRYAPTSSLLGLEEPVLESSTQPFEDSSDIRWLRDKHLADEADADRPSATRRFAPALLAALAIAALFYAQWRPSQTSSRQAAQPASSAPAAQDKTSEPAPKPSESAKATSPEAAPENPTHPATPLSPHTQASAPAAASAASVQARPEAPPPLTPTEVPRPQASAKPATPSLAPPVASSDFGNGATELAQAEDYLYGRNGSRDTTAAARLLWQAVGKENTSAILLLSNMYMIGEGVPKNCDQARVLLYAAARKHVAQAADKLRNLERSGCP